MRVTAIPDGEVFADHEVKTIHPPEGRTDVDPADAQVTLLDGVPIFRFRLECDPGEPDRLALGEPIWLSVWGHVVPFDARLVEPDDDAPAVTMSGELKRLRDARDRVEQERDAARQTFNDPDLTAPQQDLAAARAWAFDLALGFLDGTGV